MWLLDVQTLQLQEFFGDKIPKYAILSHRWEEEEVSFDDMKASPQHLKGYAKIQAFCTKALSEGYIYGWVDTCCIDKKSSAELSEAINSMYRWYERSEICYVYLSDAETAEDVVESLWFTRGWTLQELIAPRTVLFYNKRWNMLGSKSDLSRAISARTKIPEKALLNFRPSEYSIAQRMSWTTGRSTTREEDQAYCLLGITEVNMPMLYGEGPKAFRRLQDEIMRQNNDLSIFLWEGAPDPDFGMLAARPQSFATSYLPDPFAAPFALKSGGYLVYNHGIEISARLYPFCLFNQDVEPHRAIEVYAAFLETNYRRTNNYGVECIRILLIRKGHDSYVRVAIESSNLFDYKTVSSQEEIPLRRIIIRREPIIFIPLSSISMPRFFLTPHSTLNTSFRYGVAAEWNKQSSRDPDHFSQPSTSTCVEAYHSMGRHRQKIAGHVTPCACTTYVVEPKMGEVYGCVCWLSITSSLPLDVSIATSTDCIQVTLCFGFDLNFRPIYLAVPFLAPSKRFSGNFINKKQDFMSAFDYLVKSAFEFQSERAKDSGIIAGYAFGGRLALLQDYSLGVAAVHRDRDRTDRCERDIQWDMLFDAVSFFRGQYPSMRLPVENNFLAAIPNKATDLLGPRIENRNYYEQLKKFEFELLTIRIRKFDARQELFLEAMRELIRVTRTWIS